MKWRLLEPKSGFTTVSVDMGRDRTASRPKSKQWYCLLLAHSASEVHGPDRRPLPVEAAAREACAGVLERSVHDHRAVWRRVEPVAQRRANGGPHTAAV